VGSNASYASPSPSMNHRSFDLGGGGLKTCIYHNGVQNPQCFCNLGVSENNDIDRWIRERLPRLAQEISEGTVFSFSLAGLDKLAKTQLPNDRDPESIAKLFELPVDRVYALSDGDAHLVASRTCLSITEFPQINFSVGTGVGIGMYDNGGQQVPEDELISELGKPVWEFVIDCSASRTTAGFALGSRGYKKLERQDPSTARSLFEERWRKFLKDQFYSALGLVPKTITFTGGIVDYANLFSGSQTLEGCQIQRGPNDAGLLGAMLHAEQTQQRGEREIRE